MHRAARAGWMPEEFAADEPTDMTPNGEVSDLLAGTAQQIEDVLERHQEAGTTMPLLWPPFRTCRRRRR